MVNKQLIKEKIELLSKQHQIELLRILSIIPGISISENNNGVFINLTQQNDIVFEKIEKFLEYVNVQQKSLSFLEKQQKRNSRVVLPFTCGCKSQKKPSDHQQKFKGHLPHCCAASMAA